MNVDPDGGDALKILSNNQLAVLEQEGDEKSVQTAPLSKHVSFSDYDVEENLFFSTIDKIMFLSPLEVISKVLSANGFIVNLENILSCFDTIKFGAIAKNDSANKISFNEYQHCLMFQMPSKSHQGPVLGQFYKEIEAYEAEVRKLRAIESEYQEGNGKKSYDQLLKENKKFRLELQNMSMQLQDLGRKLNMMQRANSQSAMALESANVMPPNLRLAKVKSIIIEERNVLLRVGRRSLHLPFDLIPFLPSEGDICMVKLVDGNVSGAYFFESFGRPFEKSVGTVLFTNGVRIKVRDEHRIQHILTASNRAEEEKFSQFKRNDRILIEKIESQIVRVELCGDVSNRHLQNKVQEQIVLDQLNQKIYKAEKHVVVKKKRRRKEVA